MALTAVVKASIKATLTRSLDLASGSSELSKFLSASLADGVGADQANLIFHDQRTLSASATEDLDLAGGGLVDIFGNAFAPARLKAMLVYAAAGNTNNVNVTRPGANGVPIYLAAGDGEPVHPGCWIEKIWKGATGIVVTAGTGDLITFTNSAGSTSVTYDVILIGANA